ncbi:MAG: enoyl-CoA hydratase/isomerase family protein [Firmicutes bacterium]|nr:enoyl-CoA hydratase/isomerase family protein [Alicyclobacillaceae bacterium]MCL6497548.1 enoyl-CoA hydratase/isomerase family protein [Bacillota bacterium]
MSGQVHYEPMGAAVRLRIDNPPVNALSPEMVEQLDHGLSRAEADPAVAAVVIASTGAKAFMAGLDIKAVGDYSVEAMAAFGQMSARVLSHVETSPKPVICAVQGIAYGAGFELALACDFRLATPQAVFALPELTLGLIPGGGGTQRLTRLVGASRAKQVILLGESIAAAEAAAMGLLVAVVEPDALDAKVAELVARLSERPPVALAEAKRAIHRGQDLPLELGLEWERQAFLNAFRSEDAQEGLRAFREKRPPVFRGR